ncbi:MAG: NAD(P)-binding domain-containing protein [Candidatus Limnocylindrales bacterium]|nr:NAD(P)-binding domain-containing protein [Candidatus Limnocylindrales bacterium]
MEHVDVLVVGGGSAGLSVSHELARLGIDHVILERGRIGQAWRDRWDSFCLVTPNWTVRLPGGEYAGADPDGFLPRDEIVAHLEWYAATLGAPIREGVAVRTIERAGDGFVALTSAGDIHAYRVVLATGAFQRAYRPAGSTSLPAGLLQMDMEEYRNAASLPPGPVLVVGSGQSGCQLAEELREAGRDVVLACGKAPWGPRRIGDRDLVWWLEESGFLGQPVTSLPSPAARLGANPIATGHGGGHDLSLRTLRAMGVTLVGRFLGAAGSEARFAADLADSVAWGDARFREIKREVLRVAAERGLPRPEIAEPAPFPGSAPERVSLDGYGAVVFAGGFRPDFRSWLPWTDAFDDLGFPVQVDGASTVVDGLYFVGTHFLRTRKSSTLLGVGDDAAVVARAIAGRTTSA